MTDRKEGLCFSASGRSGHFETRHRSSCLMCRECFDDRWTRNAPLNRTCKHFSIKNEGQVCEYLLRTLDESFRTYHARSFPRNPFPSLSNIDTLRQKKYDANLIDSIKTATLLKSLTDCTTINSYMHSLIRKQNMYASSHHRLVSESRLPLSLSLSVRRSTTFKHVYAQASSSDVKTLLSVLPCFGLFPHEPLGMYHGVLRFSSNANDFYLVGSKSVFYTS